MKDEDYINLALKEARKGIGKVSPNPMVGCVIVKNGKIIGKGYHKKYGGNHAEINAINSAQTSVKNSSVYITLEPCSIYGNTPPCVDRLIKEGVKKVIIGTKDPNPLVNGRGIYKLKKANIDVRYGVNNKNCLELNKFFNKFMNKGIPYVTLKAAVTLDGKIADENGKSKWISSIESRMYVHKLRSEYDAVLVGINTVVKDNPSLNVRMVKGRNPKKIVLDSSLRINLKSKVFDSSVYGDLIVITSQKSKVKKRKIKLLEKESVKILFVNENSDGNLNLKNVLKKLAKEKITSVLVEGGSKIFNSFIRQKLFDEIQLFVCPKIFGKGLTWSGNDIALRTNYNYEIIDNKKIGSDILLNIKTREK